MLDINRKGLQKVIQRKKNAHYSAERFSSAGRWHSLSLHQSTLNPAQEQEYNSPNHLADGVTKTDAEHNRCNESLERKL